ncbi:MAG: tetratricopeptide repeat protein [Bryobacteraceae bacterium]
MRKWLAFCFLLLLVNTAYVAAFAQPTVFYMGNVLLHVVLGLAAFLLLWWSRPAVSRFTFAVFSVAAGLGVFLVFSGATRQFHPVLVAHIIAAAIGLAALIPYALKATPTFRNGYAAAVAVLVLLPLGAHIYDAKFPDPNLRIRNPLVVPVSMREEGGGPKSPFWPSSSKTNVGGIIPSNFFMDSQACGECHKDIYNQWKSSMHHFASFNNQFYRKSIEYMQSVAGVQPTKWCAGCHDHAVFFNGRFEKPIEGQIDTPEAQNGLGCMSCHSIVHVGSSMGNADFTMEYPPLHELASSKNPVVHAMDHFLTYLDPEPHRRTFLKPFMKEDTAEFCASCHKVHLDVPVNNYRWQRGFNDYDNWQASGVSGQGARSFYYPQKSSMCADCHMPLVASRDPGNIAGKIHSHRFPAANMAVAYVNRDQAQMEEERKFLTSGFITVDIFAASPIDDAGKQISMRRRTSDAPVESTTFASGEESEQTGPVFIREVGKIAAPIDHSGVTFQPGSTIRVDTVVRTRKIGHFFPAGTVDAFDVWLELEGCDADGRKVFWSGMVEDNGRGPVEPGAHFYKSYQIDEDGNEINKRNAFQSRSLLYVRLIPPGAADVAHFRVKIPKDARGPITLTARLNYRKFSRYYTQFAYAGQPKPGQPADLVSVTHESRQFSFDKANIPANVSGQIKGEIPDLPIVVLARAEAKLPLGGQTNWQPVVEKKDRERWNDWGIGLLLQGDLKGAEYAFRKVTEAEPGYADGWLNVARALIQEGETDAAKPFIEKALSIDSSLGRIWFFKAMIQKADGDFDGAVASLKRVQRQYPRDRVALNQLGRILFLERQYADAVTALQGVLAVDPEDVQAHYNLMLAYRGLGNVAGAQREQKLFERFKADESAQSITSKPRMSNAEANNERQLIHDHESCLQ